MKKKYYYSLKKRRDQGIKNVNFSLEENHVMFDHIYMLHYLLIS